MWHLKDFNDWISLFLFKLDFYALIKFDVDYAHRRMLFFHHHFRSQAFHIHRLFNLKWLPLSTNSWLSPMIRRIPMKRFIRWAKPLIMTVSIPISIRIITLMNQSCLISFVKIAFSLHGIFIRKTSLYLSKINNIFSSDPLWSMCYQLIQSDQIVRCDINSSRIIQHSFHSIAMHLISWTTFLVFLSFILSLSGNPIVKRDVDTGDDDDATTTTTRAAQVPARKTNVICNRAGGTSNTNGCRQRNYYRRIKK